MIAIGFLMRRLGYGDSNWASFEKIVYQVLFPCLLFKSIVASHFDVTQVLPFMAGGLAVIGAGLVGGLLIRPWSKLSLVGFGSGLQTAYRFNSYVALAIAGRLAGEAGAAKMSILLGIGVPLCNIMAVYGLARGAGQNPFKEMLKNPLILATVGGMLFELAGITLPDPALRTLDRLGQAAIALGLLAVGAGLHFEGLKTAWLETIWWTLVKLLVCPLAAWLFVQWVPLPPLQYQMLLLFASLPTASSAYILAVRLGGDYRMVACLISVSTVLSAVTIPWVIRHLG